MKKKTMAVFAVAALAVLGLFFWQRQQAAKNKITSGTSFAMNTVIEQKWFGPAGEAAYEAVSANIHDIESTLSSHIDTSVVARINQNAGIRPVEVSEEVFALLERAKALSSASQQSFDITIAPVVELWGITGDTPKVPSEEELQLALSQLGLEELVLDAQKHTAYLPRAGMAIDLGGIAKGWSCDRLREVALKKGITSGYVSLGGNLMVIGDKPSGEPFKFGLRNPLGAANEFVGILTLKGKTMATTGGYERFFEEDGVRYHHVLDPRTGYPAESDLLSVSVISSDGLLADYLSTTFFVLGKEAAMAHLEDERFELVIIDAEGNVYVSPSLQPSFTPNTEAEGFAFTDY